MPYSQGIGESVKNICKKHGVDVHFKGGQTLKNILVSPKDKDNITSKSSVIYSYTCGEIDCDEEYIKPLMGCSIHHVQNSTQFAEELK